MPLDPDTADRAAVLQVHGITKDHLLGEVVVQALRRLDLDLHDGEFVVLLGASGSGKSTLLDIPGGLDVPTTGSVRYGDHDLTAAGERALTRYRREHVGFLFQFHNLLPGPPAVASGAVDRCDRRCRRDRTTWPLCLRCGRQPRGCALRRGVARRDDLTLLLRETGGALEVGSDELGETRSHDRFVVAAPVAGRLRRRALVLGHFGVAGVEVRGGLTAGERVIAHPPNDLEDGGRVRLRSGNGSTA